MLDFELKILNTWTEADSSGHYRRRALVLCYCGIVFETAYQHIKRGTTRSCGCRPNPGRTVHGHHTTKYKSPTYVSWASMIQRVTNPKCPMYYCYGGRGICICPEWRIFSNFLQDMKERPSLDYSIDRIDNNGNYEPSNCRWLLKRENSRKGGR